MKWMKKVIQSMIIGIFFISCFPLTGYGTEVPISVNPIFPDNQINDADSFYNLRVTPGQKETLSLEVTNSGDAPVTIHTEVVPAGTAMTGNIVYTAENSKQVAESNKYPLPSLAKAQEDVTIPAKEKTTVDIALTIPDESFEGVILGGVRVSIVTPEGEEEKEESSEGFSVTNVYSYVVAIQLSEKDELPKPDLKILKVYASQISGRNTLKINLQNPANVLVDDVQYEAKVYRKGKEEEVLHQASYQDYRMAPANTFDLPVTWDNKPFQAGTYILKLEANSGKPEGNWSFNQEFTISEKEAKELNAKAVELDKDYTMYILIGVVAGVFLILLIILLLVLRNKKKKKQRRKKVNGGKGRQPLQQKRPTSQKPRRAPSDQSTRERTKRPVNRNKKRI